MEALELLPIASLTLLGAATAVRCRLFGQRWRQRRQQDGVQWCGTLQNLVMHLQRHRGLSSMWLNGDRSVGPRLHAEREQANQHMHTLAQLPDGHLSAADVLPRAQWERFCADWRALCAELEQLAQAKQQIIGANLGHAIAAGNRGAGNVRRHDDVRQLQERIIRRGRLGRPARPAGRTRPPRGRTLASDLAAVRGPRLSRSGPAAAPPRLRRPGRGHSGPLATPRAA